MASLLPRCYKEILNVTHHFLRRLLTADNFTHDATRCVATKKPASNGRRKYPSAEIGVQSSGRPEWYMMIAIELMPGNGDAVAEMQFVKKSHGGREHIRRVFLVENHVRSIEAKCEVSVFPSYFAREVDRLGRESQRLPLVDSNIERLDRQRNGGMFATFTCNFRERALEVGEGGRAFDLVGWSWTAD